MMELSEIFSEKGPFADLFPHYKPRSQQLEMAQAVAQTMQVQGQLIAEAGTGTGKTFAYLVPALLLGGKVIISTGTKTLQDQLFERDIPCVRKILKTPVTVALLKGRSNYICHYYLARAQEEGRFLSKEEVIELQAVARYSKASSTGDKAHCPGVSEDAAIWNHVTSTQDNCLGQSCPNYKDCFVLKARKEALDADIVVVNHHLFFADIWLRDEMAGELLPAAHAIIFDEAHQLPEVATLFFGETITLGQIIDLARDTTAESMVTAKDFALLPQAAQAVEKAVRDIRLTFQLEGLRIPFKEIERWPEFMLSLTTLFDRLNDLLSLLEKQAERGKGLEKCLQRTQDILNRLASWKTGDTPESVHWIDVLSHGFILHTTPLDISPIFQKQLELNARAWIFTSATLAVNGTFEHFKQELGLTHARTTLWGSPFDYKQRAVLYVPLNMPDPNTAEYTQSLIEQAWPLLILTQGHAFILCTSYKAMREVHTLLQSKLKEEEYDWPLLLQGQSSRTELLAQFRLAPHSILVGSQTFWEGIDVKGQQLSLVIIDKLPFSPPDDPVLAARIEQVKRSGRNPFLEYQLPHAVIALKQGAGRLIRDENDRGILMIADNRIVEKQYGKLIWNSLPPMYRTRRLSNVKQFFKQIPFKQ